MMIPQYIPTNVMVSAPGFKAVQDFVHPQLVTSKYSPPQVDYQNQPELAICHLKWSKPIKVTTKRNSGSGSCQGALIWHPSWTHPLYK